MLNILRILIGVVVLYIVGYVFYWMYVSNVFVFHKEINFVDSLAILVNTTVLLYISTVFNKKEKSSDIEKEILIKYFEEFRIRKNTILTTTINQGKTSDYLNTLPLELKNIRNELYNKINLLEEKKYIKSDQDFVQNLNVQTKNFWEFLTYEPNKEEIGAFDRTIYFIKAQYASNKIDQELFKVFVAINLKK